jgi:hypothetical protein
MPERKSTLVEAGDAEDTVRGVIEDIARKGARKILQEALEAEVQEHLAARRYAMKWSCTASRSRFCSFSRREISYRAQLSRSWQRETT